MLFKKVKVVEVVESRDFTEESQWERVKFAGCVGTVVKEHRGHGLCYDVRFENGIAAYDPDELSLV